jgi:rhodanese-related sulfurtransferase
MTIKKSFIIVIIVLIVFLFLALVAKTGKLVYARVAGTDEPDSNYVFILPNESGFYDITPAQLEDRIKDKSDNNYIIVDIRDEASYEEAHVPGAINIPLNQLGYSLYGLDRTKDIIVYCFTGVTSEVACQILVNAGFKDVYNMMGGIKAWNYPVETSDGRVNI